MRINKEIRATVGVDITPEDMAKCFWGMSDEGQAEFFTHLAAVITEDYKTNDAALSFGKLQWYAMTKKIERIGGDTLRVFGSFTCYGYEI